MKLNEKFYSLLRPIMALLLGLFLSLIFTTLAGENPFTVLKVLFNGALGSSYNLGMTLLYTSFFIFTGLSVSIAFHGGLFNVGAEGQLTLGALAAAIIGISFPISITGGEAGSNGDSGSSSSLLAFFSFCWPPLLASLGAFVVGGLWGALAGWLRARRGSHEVITTIMLNFIALGLASYLTLYVFPNSSSSNPETASINPAFILKPFSIFNGAPVGMSLILAIVTCLVFWFFFKKTSLGFEIQATGQNEKAALTAGISTAGSRILAFFLAGGVAGLVGVTEVLGNAHRFRLGFSPNFGFTGIAVALLSRGNPLAIIPSAFLFAVLHKGAGNLDLETNNITRDLAFILQGLIILCISADGLWYWLKPQRKKEKTEGEASKHE